MGDKKQKLVLIIMFESTGIIKLFEIYVKLKKLSRTHK